MMIPAPMPNLVCFFTPGTPASPANLAQRRARRGTERIGQSSRGKFLQLQGAFLPKPHKLTAGQLLPQARCKSLQLATKQNQLLRLQRAADSRQRGGPPRLE